MISAEQFLKVLAEKDLLSSDVVRKLRKQVAESSKPIPAAAVAKRLIDKGYLTPALVKRLLKEADKTAPRQEKKTTPAPKPEEEELGFAPTEEEKEKEREKAEAERRRQAAKREAAKREAATSVEPKPKPTEKSAPTPLTAKPAASPPTPPGPVAPPPRPAGSPAATPAADEVIPYKVVPSEVVTGEVLVGEVVTGEVVSGEVVMDAEPVEVVSADAVLDADAVFEGGSLAPVRPRLTAKNFFLMFLPGRKRGRKENVWDSSLLLIGGGALLLLVILLGALGWSLLWQSGDQMVEAANQLYREGSYTQAIEMYDRFLNQFSTHEQASLARVRRGFCQMRQATDVTTDYSKALDVAKEVLGEVGKETAFGEAKPELQGMLTKIAEGLAKQAREKTDPTLVEQTREAVGLIEKFVSKSAQNKPLMDDIEASLALTEREIAREDELAKAVAAMRKAIDEHKNEDGYRIRKSLLKNYPDLLDDARLREAILKVSAAEKTSVKTVGEARAAEKPDPAGAVATEMAVACRALAREAPGAQGHVIYVLAEGAAYALDAATGKVLWRRFVGYQTNGSSLGFGPTPVADEPGSDALLVDAAGDALVRVEAKTGKLRWRHAVGGKFDAHPVIDGNRVLVATVDGRLVSIDLASGDAPDFIQLPQSLAVAPTVDAKRSKIYQVAEHSNLYILAADGKCEQVVYLAHEPGSITAAPVILSRLLVVAENRGVDNAVLRLFSLDAEGKQPAFTPVQEIELLGHVDASPLVAGAQLLVTTDQGWVTAFRLSGTDTTKPLEKVAQIQAGNERDLVRFPLLVRDAFWIAGNSLTKYEIQSSLGNFRTQWVACKDSIFRQPVTAVGETLFLARRRMNLPGMFVSAMAMDKPDVLWETTLGAPLVGEPVVQPSGRIEAVTALGAVIEVPSADVKGQSVVDQPAVAMKTDDLQRPIENVLRTPDGLLVLCTGPGTDQISVFDRVAAADRFRRVVLLDPLAAAPAAFAGGLMVPSQVGQVFLVDPRTGGKMVEPFQGELAGGSRLPWRQAVRVDENSVVLADGGNRIYRLGIKDQPKRHLAALDQVETAKPIVSPVAVVGNVAYAVDEAGVLQRFVLPKLTPGEPTPLGGKPVWGPHRAGDHVFLATDDEQLLCLDGDGKLVWKTALLYGPLAGHPLPLGKEYLLAYAGGVVSRVDAATGKELGKLDTGHPLGTGAVLLGEQLLLCGNDGTLYVVESGK